MRFKKSITPNELNKEFRPNSYISIKLPNAKLDLHSFTLYYDGLPANHGETPTYTIRRFFPLLSSSIIDELIIKIDGQVKQYIREYNMIHSILNDIYKETEDLQGTAFDTIQEHKFDVDNVIQQELKIQSVAGSLGMFYDDFKESFFISEWLGFLQEGSSRYFDARKHNIEIIIKTAPANILYKGIHTSDLSIVNTEYEPDYKLSNVYATIDILDDIPAMPSEYEFMDYHYTQGMYSDQNKNSVTSFQIDKPVKWLLGTFSSEDRYTDSGLQLQHTNDVETIYGLQLQNNITNTQYNGLIPKGLLYSYEIAKAQKKPYLLNSSVYFAKNGLGINYTKFKMNTFDLTPQMNMVSCYNETKKCFGSKYKKVLSLQQFESDFFVNAIRVDANDQEFKNFEWEVNAKLNGIGGKPMLFCCFVNKI